MTRTPHLTPDQLIDLVDGNGGDAVRRHVESCAACRRDFDEVVATLAVVGDDPADDPSPLFWEHLPGRVARAIDSERPATVASWWGRRVVWMPASLAAAALLVVAVALVSRSGPTPGVREAVPAAPTAAVAGDHPSWAEDGDPTWDVVTVLSAGLGDAGGEAGEYDGAPGTVERAVEGLSEREQGELVRLLEEVLAKRPS